MNNRAAVVNESRGTLPGELLIIEEDGGFTIRGGAQPEAVLFGKEQV